MVEIELMKGQPSRNPSPLATLPNLKHFNAYESDLTAPSTAQTIEKMKDNGMAIDIF